MSFEELMLSLLPGAIWKSIDWIGKKFRKK